MAFQRYYSLIDYVGSEEAKQSLHFTLHPGPSTSLFFFLFLYGSLSYQETQTAFRSSLSLSDVTGRNTMSSFTSSNMALLGRTPDPNYINPVTMSTTIIAVGATSSALAFFFLCTKLYAALRIFHSVKLDHYTTLVAFLFTLANVSLLLNTRKDARHTWDLSNTEFAVFHVKVIFAGTMVGALGLSFAKLSILFLFYRLFLSCRRLRFAIYIGIAWTILICVNSLVMALVLCAPRSSESSSSPKVIDRCTKFELWSVVRGTLSVLLDFYILYLPVPTVWNLQLGIKKKIGVLSIFMTGLM